MQTDRPKRRRLPKRPHGLMIRDRINQLGVWRQYGRRRYQRVHHAPRSRSNWCKHTIRGAIFHRLGFGNISHGPRLNAEWLQIANETLKLNGKVFVELAVLRGLQVTVLLEGSQILVVDNPHSPAEIAAAAGDIDHNLSHARMTRQKVFVGGSGEVVTFQLKASGVSVHHQSYPHPWALLRYRIVQHGYKPLQKEE